MRKQNGQEQRLGRPNGRRVQVRLDFVAQDAKEGAAQALDELLAGIVHFAGGQDIAAALAKAIEVAGYSDVRLVGAASGGAAGGDGRRPWPDEPLALPRAGEECQAEAVDAFVEALHQLTLRAIASRYAVLADILMLLGMTVDRRGEKGLEALYLPLARLATPAGPADEELLRLLQMVDESGPQLAVMMVCRECGGAVAANSRGLRCRDCQVLLWEWPPAPPQDFLDWQGGLPQ